MVIHEQKYSFHKWMTLMKFRNHTVVEEFGYANHPMEFENIYTLENSKRERIKLKESDYLILEEVICKRK